MAGRLDLHEDRMSIIRARTVRGRIFLAILAVVLVPAAITAVAGTLTLRGIGTSSGTLGAWDAVAESGQGLIASLDSAGIQDPAVRAAAERHRSALSESVRLSRLYAFVTRRFVQVLPGIMIVLTLVVAGGAFFMAGRLARGIGSPMEELVGWTERIGHGEALPPERNDEQEGLVEFRALRSSLRSMATQLDEGRERAIEAARLRSWSDLARRMAHEIKNPLTAMRMAARTLPQSESDADPARVLVEEIDRLDGIARSFSQYGKVPEGPRSEVDLLELLQSLARLETSAEIHVRSEGPVMVVGHHDALQRAFRNLLVNAAEAVDSNERARVDVHIRRLDGTARVEILDSGPGIPEELLSEIWNPDVSTKRSGTGLGLAIVRRTMEHHDGVVAASNRPEGGACFQIDLPLAPPPN